ncbi:non-ribosomal peptide synthetase [Streptantibioticus cattleyicolor]|uniref:Amino acid adenylation domain-containing protein n=1 Tax=Streptantibioticus cattleyicolor (strain ATCC 35852 / DSM 46488 / JCM 4925 / NBRC 14057 / NRRL 8057) TaxID=1003195 RepID=F8JMQ9_STREN
MPEELSPTDVFDARGDYEALTPEEQALLLLELSRRKGTAAGSIPRLPGDGAPPPPSFAQERLWFLDQADPGSAAYVMPAGVRLRGRLDVAALAGALGRVVRRHETLRTTFTAVDGRPVPRIRPAAPVPLPVEDLRALPEAERERTVRERYRRETDTPFDLENGPLLRATVLRTADEEHVLLLSVHHIACDGWSLGVLLTELAAGYGVPEDAADPLPPLPVQYADFAAWQRDQLGGDRLDAHLAFWKRQLEAPPVLDLPGDRPRPPRRTSAGDSLPLRLAPKTVARLEELGAGERATPYMVLLAAVTVLLWRWSGQDDLVVGAPVAGRPRVETEPLIGFFVNTLPLRLDVSGTPTFRELLGRVRQTCLAAYEHQDVPFERLVQDVGAERAGGQVPLVQAMVALRNTPMPELRLPGLELELLELRSTATKFDVCFDLVPDGAGGIDGRAEFSTDLFDADSVRRAVDGLQRLLAAALDDPDQPVSRLPLLDDTEHERIVREFSGGGSAAAAGTAGTVHGLFEARVDAAPDAPAVVCGDRVLSYRELDEEANRLAHHLRARGVGREQIVGICLPRSERMVVTVLALLKAGAAYVPLDPMYPRRRVAYMAADAGVRLVLSESSVARDGRFDPPPDAPPGYRPPEVVEVDTEAARIAGCPAGRPGTGVAPGHLAYVIYTSGSTGRPKGSMNEHGGIANSVTAMNEVYRLRPGDRMLAISSLNYDMSVYEVFGTLAAGAAVVVPSDIETTDPEQLRDLLRRQRVTAWSSAPALLDMLVNHAYEHDGLDGVALRVVGVGGDRMPPLLPDRLTRLVPGVELYNLAGMTEVSYCTLYHRVDPAEPGAVPWGRPLANHRVYVLDRHGRPAPVGMPGELYIGGAGPGRGYHARPALTAERFVPDPFSPVPGGRMYATGDVAAFRPDGVLRFLGRLDHQVKIRGFRIEPGEVEAALGTHPDVVEPVVTAYQDERGTRRLVAHLTVREGTRPDPADLRHHLLQRLPDHMVPSAFVVMDRLPLLPSGKLNRAALPAPTGGRPELAGRYEPPAGALEEVLAGIWAEVLGLERVGVLDDFFDLGGHSLLATQVVSRIRDTFRLDLSIAAFLSVSTVRELAVVARQSAAGAGTDADAVAELVRQVDALSEEEVARRLGAD